MDHGIEPLLNTPIITFFNTNVTDSQKLAWFAFAFNYDKKLLTLDIRHKQSSAKAADDFFLKIFQWREENFRAPSGSGP